MNAGKHALMEAAISEAVAIAVESAMSWPGGGTPVATSACQAMLLAYQRARETVADARPEDAHAAGLLAATLVFLSSELGQQVTDTLHAGVNDA